MSIVFGAMVPHPPLILPMVGKGEETAIEKTVQSYCEVGRRIAELQPDTIVISSPHAAMYYDYFNISDGSVAVGTLERFGVSPEEWSMSVNYDEAFVKKLCDYAKGISFPAGTAGVQDGTLDHGTLILLYFVKNALSEKEKLPKLVRIGLSGLPLSYHYMLGMLIQKAAEELDRSVVYIASGDLSHKPSGSLYDKELLSAMSTASFGDLFSFSSEFCEQAEECGHRSFVMMAGALDATGVEAKQLSYEGPFGVGYGVCTYDVVGPDGSRNFLELEEQNKKEKMAKIRKKEDQYVLLARRALEAYLTKGLMPQMDLPDEMTERRAGCFVSLHKNGVLRGCIGTTKATRETLAEEIMRNAVNAATEDPRFPKVEAYELDELTYGVDILSEAEDIYSLDELDIQKYGVIVSTDGFIPKRGLLLPDLEGIHSVEEQVSIAKQKANIRDDEAVKLQRFTVERHVVPPKN